MTQRATITDRAPPLATETKPVTPRPVPATRRTPPFSIRASVWLMLAGMLTSLVAFLAWIPTRDTVPDQAQPGESIAVAGFWITVGLVGIVAVGSWLWMARVTLRGRLWARTATTVLVGAFSGFMVLTASGIASPDLGDIGAPATSLAWIISLAAVALLYRKDAVAYYADIAKA